MTDQIPQMQLVKTTPKRSRKKRPLLDSAEVDRVLQENEALEQQLAIRNGEPSVALMLQSLVDGVQSGKITSDNVKAIESMVGLYERMEDKKAERTFATAFEKLQAGVKRIQATHPVPAKDGTIKYHVAKFQEVWDEVEPELMANGFTASFAQKYEEGLPLRVTTTFILQHTDSGHKTETPFTVRVGNGPPGCVDYQADGAASSYAKMRSMCGKLNIIIESGDDDAKMIGTPIGKALSEDLEARVRTCGADREAFLKYAGANSFSEISDERYPVLDELLKRKEAAKAAREKLSPEGEQWK